MAGIDLDRAPFLREDQTLLLERINEFNHRVEFPQDDYDSAVGNFVVVAIERAKLGFSQSKREKRAFFDTSSSGDIYAELEAILQVHAFTILNEDSRIEFLRQSTAIAVAIAHLNGDEKTEQQGNDFAQRLIADRANKNALSMLTAGWLLVNPIPGVEGRSIYDQSKDVFASATRVKPPAEIPEHEGIRLDALISQAGDTSDESNVSKPRIKGRVGLLSAVAKGTGHMLRKQRANPDAPRGLLGVVENDYEMNIAPADIEMSIEDVEFANMATTKMCRYIGGAAVLDSVIARDPRARFITFLNGELIHANHRSENAIFERDVNKYVKREEKAARRRAH